MSDTKIQGIHTFQHNLKKESIYSAIKYMKETFFIAPTIRIAFNKPVSLPINRYKRKIFTELKARFFVSGPMVCYTFHKRTGFPLFNYVMADDIVYFEIVSLAKEDKEKDRIKRALSLSKKIHPNAWSNLKKELQDKPLEALPDSNLKPVNILSRIKNRCTADYLKRSLAKAFENKEAFRWSQDGIKRDYSIETKLCPDGIFRAWFSSEYSGCGNGDYYLLINPVQAVFCETD